MSELLNFFVEMKLDPVVAITPDIIHFPSPGTTSDSGVPGGGAVKSRTGRVASDLERWRVIG